MSGFISIIGLGPGSPDWLAPAARLALENAEVILGYRTYLEQIENVAPQVAREASGMRHEIERARQAIDYAAQGKRVAVVSGGDAGIYGMAGLILELLQASDDPTIPAEVLPGISALNAAAALLGAPLMSDFAAVSLSDHLTPLEDILRRVEMAARAGFVLCLYNPNSHRRSAPFEQTCQVLRRHLPADTPVGVVRSAFRPGQKVECVTLAGLPDVDVDMNTILIVGNAATRVLNGRMVTPRGYENKYDLKGTA
jgi:precorrin-3B C17-methyltransferase